MSIMSNTENTDENEVSEISRSGFYEFEKGLVVRETNSMKFNDLYDQERTQLSNETEAEEGDLEEVVDKFVGILNLLETLLGDEAFQEKFLEFFPPQKRQEISKKLRTMDADEGVSLQEEAEYLLEQIIKEGFLPDPLLDFLENERLTREYALIAEFISEELWVEYNLKIEVQDFKVDQFFEMLLGEKKTLKIFHDLEELTNEQDKKDYIDALLDPKQISLERLQKTLINLEIQTFNKDNLKKVETAFSDPLKYAQQEIQENKLNHGKEMRMSLIPEDMRKKVDKTQADLIKETTTAEITANSKKFNKTVEEIGSFDRGKLKKVELPVKSTALTEEVKEFTTNKLKKVEPVFGDYDYAVSEQVKTASKTQKSIIRSYEENKHINKYELAHKLQKNEFFLLDKVKLIKLIQQGNLDGAEKLVKEMLATLIRNINISEVGVRISPDYTRLNDLFKAVDGQRSGRQASTADQVLKTLRQFALDTLIKVAGDDKEALKKAQQQPIFNQHRDAITRYTIGFFYRTSSVKEIAKVVTKLENSCVEYKS